MIRARLVVPALLAERLFGYPKFLEPRLPHPVNALGVAISGLEKRWNREQYEEDVRARSGALALLLVAGAATAAGLVADRTLARRGLVGLVGLTALATLGLAQRSLDGHVADVADALDRSDLQTARAAVGRIVGRDTASLDQSGVAAAALESLAESFNDGVVAPALWLAVAGLPGLYLYKAVNTADSLIGHMEPRWRSFGKASAKTDDLMNLAPARLAGVLIAIAGGGGFRTMARDASKHASPNAGWPEAAMAGALRVELGGQATYDGRLAERPRFGNGPRPGPKDLRRGLTVYRRALGLLLLLMAGLSWRR